MLGRGQQQDSISDIIEKGNFVGPANNETDELYDNPKKWKWVLKIGLIVVLTVFLIYGLYSLFGSPMKNDVFTDAFFQDVEQILLYGIEPVSGENMHPVIQYLKGLKLTPSDIVLANKNEAGEVLYGGPAIMTFRTTDGAEVNVFTAGNVITFIGGESYTANDDDLYSTLRNLFEQQADS